ncbi:MAG: hypothetical protein P4L22_07175 [Candidatus Babeliales bacterium]|nr:hypothetical protein [Candidatus Babeliales bacterium]
MCFSAQASFIASGTLLLIASLTFKNVKSPKLIPLALIPVFFAIQQFAEGMLWVILTNETYLQFKNLAIYTFLFFAYIFWPLWMPFALLKIEPKERQQKLLLVSFGVGLLVSAYNLYYLLFYGAQAKVEAHHICYNIDLTAIQSQIDLLLYWLASTLPFFISSVKYMRFLGIAITIALIFTYIAYIKFFTSVWCFFGAILSVFVYFIISKPLTKRV